MSILSIKEVTLLIKLSILGASSSLSLQANASDAIGPGDSHNKWVVGMNIGAINNPYLDESVEGFIAPSIRYNGERFFIKDDSLNVHLAKSHGFSGGLTVSLDAGFLSDDDFYEDNEKLAGIRERDATALGGIYINHDTELGRLSFNALSDIANEHDGKIAHLKYTFDLKLGHWNINPELGVLWASDEYVNHHAGVSVSEATSSLIQYNGKATTNAFAGIRARYDITEKWDINLKTGVTKLGSGFTDSSIIDDDLVYQASVGINYNF
jgi:outer membrane protein